MDNFWRIKFNEQIEFQVYKCGGCSHDNIGDEIIDESVIVEVKSSSQKSWMEAYDDWYIVRKVQGQYIYIQFFNYYFNLVIFLKF